MGRNIVLIGFMGTGKTAIGMRLAQRLNYEFVDTDKEIEKLIGLTVREIFQKYGETRFRSEEKLMAAKLSRRRHLVIATGGGMVQDLENLELLKKNGILICLKAEPEEILRRVKRNRKSRPLLDRKTSLDDIVRMLEEREPFYSQASITVNTGGVDPEQVVQSIIASLKEIEDGKG